MNSVRRCLPLMIFIAAAHLTGWAQDAQATPKKSLAELAAQAKARKTSSAKVYLDDDSFEKSKSVIPDISSGAMDNSADIIQAITDYRQTHTFSETEEVVHAWFDKHDAILAKAIDENRHPDDRLYPDASRYNTRNPREYQAEYEADLRSAREDYQTKREHALLGSKIQQTFSKVRSKLQSEGMTFDWFKIRCANGNCTF